MDIQVHNLFNYAKKPCIIQAMRVYTIVSSTLLLIIGVVGFAFSDQFHAPAHLLIVDLILGIWGIYVIFKK